MYQIIAALFSIMGALYNLELYSFRVFSMNDVTSRSKICYFSSYYMELNFLFLSINILASLF